MQFLSLLRLKLLLYDYLLNQLNAQINRSWFKVILNMNLEFDSNIGASGKWSYVISINQVRVGNFSRLRTVKGFFGHLDPFSYKEHLKLDFT
jgi:hypothetical protein